MLPHAVSGERSLLLPSSATTLNSLPGDAVIERAYLFWSGTLAQDGVAGPKAADPQVTFTVGGSNFSVNAGGGCTTVIHPSEGTAFPPFYYCRAEVTGIVAANPQGGGYNGSYGIGGVSADPAHVDGFGNCVEAPNPRCQAKYAGWSLVVIYRSASETLQRDIHLFDGFLVVDHEDGPGVPFNDPSKTTFTISNFLADSNPQATLSYFAVEGDEQLGEPPQNLYPTTSPFFCDTCEDYIQVNGTTIADERAWPGNIFNESGGAGSGIDLDNIDISALIPPGSTSATITVGSGTGPVLPVEGVHGGGELFGYGWTLLTLRRPAPNFKTAATAKTVNPIEAGQGETVAYNVLVTNAGSAPATATTVSDTLPAGVSYTPGTLQINGTPCTDAADGDPCLVSGNTLTVSLGTVSHQTNNSRQIAFLATVAPSASSGATICNTAAVTSDQTPTPHSTPPACLTVVAPEIETPTKVDIDLDGGLTEPDDVIQFSITLRKQNTRPASGLSFVDDMPPNLQLLSVIAPSGSLDLSSPIGGANGRGRVDVRQITIPAGSSSVAITVLAQVDSVAEFAASGVSADQIHNRQLCNQGSLSAAFLSAPLLTDDPAAAGAANPTCFRLTYAPALGGSLKSGVDINGGRLEPGDTLRYTLSFVNSGNRAATLAVIDDLPAAVEGFALVAAIPGAVFNPPPAGSNGTGQLVLNNLVVAPGATETVSFTVTVSATAANETPVQNCAIFAVAEAPAEGRTICSPTLSVFATPELETSRKTVADDNGGLAQPGDTLTYTITADNTGNRPATSVVVTDQVSANLINVVPSAGGSYDPTTRTITWAVGDLAPATTSTLSFSAEISSPLPNGTVICNQARIASAELASEPTNDPATPANDDPTCVSVVSAPDFATTDKTVTDLDGAPTRPTDTLRYAITVRNSGTEDATGVIVTDVIAAELAAINPLDGGSYNPATRTVTWSIGALAAGGAATVRFEAQVVTPLDNGTPIDNQARVTADQTPAPGTPSDDPATPAVDDPTRLLVTSAPDLSTSTKAVVDDNGGVPQPGDVQRYTVTLINTGDAISRDVVVSDVVAANLTAVTPLDGGVFDPATRTITWPGRDVAPGTPVTVRFTAQIIVGLADGTVICNQATASGPGLIGAVPTDDPTTSPADDSTCLTVQSEPDLGGTTKTVSDLNGGDVEPGDTLRYTITVDNIGTEGATGVVLADVVPANLEAIVAEDGGSYDQSTRTITWTIGALAAKAQAVRHFTAQVVTPLDDGTPIANQAQATGSGLTPALSDDPATPANDDPTTVTIRATPVLATSTKAVSDDDGGDVEPDDTLTYTITVINSGKSNADQVVVSDTLAANLTFVSATAGGVYDAGNRTITWSATTTPALSQLSPGPANAVTLSFVARVATVIDNGTEICNQALLASEELTTPEPSDNPLTPAPGDPSCVTVRSEPDLANTTKTVIDDNGGQLRPGDALSYSITIVNSGNASATSVVVTDVVDQALEDVVVGQGGSFEPATRTITWSAPATPALQQIAADSTAPVTLSFTARVRRPLDNGTVVSNQARITSPELPVTVLTDDPATPAPDDPTLITVVSAPVLETSTKVVTDDNGGDPVPGDTLTYTITVRNTGDALASGVVVRDVVPPGLDQVQPFDGGTFAATTRTITWTLAAPVALSPAGDVTLRFRARIVTPLKNGTVIANQARIAHAAGPEVPTDDPTTPAADDPTRVTVVSAPDLSGLSKRVEGTQPGQRARPGTTLTYFVEIANSGTDTASEVTVTDQVDPRLVDVLPFAGGTFDPATRTITWTVPAIAVGQTVTRGFSARVGTAVADGTTIDNQAFARTAAAPAQVPSDDPSTPLVDDPTRVRIEASVDLEAFDKAVVDDNGGDAVPGDTLSYTLTIRNDGTAAAFNVIVTDRLPAALELVSVGQGGVFNAAARTITWSAATTPQLALVEPTSGPSAADPVTLTFVARIRVPTNNGTLVSNQAEIRASGQPSERSNDPATSVDDDPTELRVVSVPELTGSTKEVDDLNGGEVRPGDVLRYTLRLRNSGSGNATRVLLVDAIPTYTDYVAGSTTLNGAPLADVAGAPPFAGGLAASSPGLAAGTITVGDERAAVVSFRVRVRPDTPRRTIVSNQGMIRSAELPLVVTDDPRTAQRGDPTQVVVGSGPNLNNTLKTFGAKPLDDNGNGRFDVGERVRYRVEVPNHGTGPASAVVFTDTLDANERSLYVPGTLTLDGAPLSDAEDGDAGVASGRSIRVALGQLAAGQTRVIGYDVRIIAGPQLVNQGTVRARELPPEPTDADANELNGDSPTVVPVGADARRIRGDKRVLDVNGGFVEAGDQLLYTITVYNDGSRDEQVDVTDQLPEGVTFVTGSALTPPGTSMAFDPPPAGQFSRGRLRLPGVAVPAGASRAVVFRARLDGGLTEGAAVCNQAGIAAGGGLDLQSTEPACVLLGSPVGTGGLRGVVFRDLGKDDKVLGDDDQRLAGFTVQALYSGDPNASAVARAVTDEQGRYALTRLPPGPYTLRVLNKTGAQMGVSGAVPASAGRTSERDLPIDPSGLVYESVSGRLRAGVKVLLHYDESDAKLVPGGSTLVPERLLGAGQQGQVTDDTGFYRFDVAAGRRYRLVLEPRSTSLQFPSSLLPARPGFAVTGPANEVVPDDTPDPTREGAKLTYYLRFKVDSKDDEVFNNHVPVDPISSLIRLEKRADRARASVGDIVGYTITVENRSTRSFTTQGNLVGVEDLLPRGLRLLRGTTRRLRRLRQADARCLGQPTPRTTPDGARICVDRAEPTTSSGRILRFGPMALGAGETAQIFYQVAIGLDSKLGPHSNVAVLKDDGFAVQLSNRDEARVTVEADPDLDQGLLIGRVFCDTDGDGRLDAGERGVAGARVYLDNGSYSVTDATGKYHLRDIDPGLRLVKLDVNTLRPGSRLTTDVSRVVHFTRGLPAKINFGATCRENWVSVQKLKRAPKPRPKKAEPSRQPKRAVVPALSIAGDAKALRLTADGRVERLLLADLALRRLPATGSQRAAGERRSVKPAGWDSEPALTLDARPRRGLLFELDARASAGAAGTPAPRVHGWHLTIWRLEGGQRRLLRRFSGAGRPPVQLAWNGKLGGRRLLGGHGVYEAQLELTGLGGGARSPRRRLVLGRGAAVAPPAATPSATLDGQRLALDDDHRFATTVGRVDTRRALVLRLERGDGKASWRALRSSRSPDKPAAKANEVAVEGNLQQAALRVAGEEVDTSLLRLSLTRAGAAKGPLALDRRGRLRQPVALAPLFTSALVQRWTVRISDPSGRQLKTISGLAPVPKRMVWDGTDDAGVDVILPGRSYLARLILDDGRGSLGQSAPLLLRTAARRGGALELRGARLIARPSGAPNLRTRLRLLAAARAARRRGGAHQLTVTIAPPKRWKPARVERLLEAARQKLTALVRRAGLPAGSIKLEVTALAPDAEGRRLERLRLSPAAATETRPTPAKPAVRVDGTLVPVNGPDGGFRARVSARAGAALLIDLRDGDDRRALLLVAVGPRGPAASAPTSQPAPAPRYDLSMRDDATSQPTSAPTSAPAKQTRGPWGADVLREGFARHRARRGVATRPASRPVTKGTKVAAARLKVDLPPRGAVLKSHQLVVRGQSHPDNQVTVNGQRVALGADGRFSHPVTLADGKSELTIQARDRAGNVGTIRWPVRVSDRALFLMAMAEGAIGQPGVELDEDSAHSRLDSDALLLRGRAVVYLKGRIKGRYLFKRYLVTAHVDTAKQRELEDFFDQVVDPNRYYPIYGDSAEHVRDVNSRGKFYVLVEADRSKLVVGNFHAGVRGVDLLRYDRALHGVKVDLDKQLVKGKLALKTKVFISNDDSRLARDHNVLRATGGSIYYLRHGQVLEGSERVRIVVRERDTGLKLAEVLQTRDQDYVIDYPGGRILFKTAVASVADAGFSATNPAFTLATLAGHPVYVEADYEYEADGAMGSGSWGAQAKTTLFDVLTVGATYVSETRAAEVGADYQLYGAELTYRFRKATVLTAEIARSASHNAQNFISEDGGVTYLGLNHTALASADERATDAGAIKITAKAELSDFVRSVAPDTLKVSGYFSRLERGFFSGGTILDQGRTRFGGRVDWSITDGDALTLRHDGAIALLPQLNVGGTSVDPLKLREIETELTRLSYRLRRRRFELTAEYAHGYSRDPLLADGNLASHRDSVGVLASYRLAKWLKVTLGQDAMLHVTGTDPQLGTGSALGLTTLAGDDPLDRLMTSVGVAVRLTKRFELQIAEQLRWSGDNATSIGVRTQLSKTAATYVKQLFGTTDDRFSATTVVGAEDRFGEKLGGRTYGEYQLESGVLGRRNRAILGMTHKWAPWRGIGFSGGFEHQQVFGGRLPDGTPTGDSQRDVVHVGVEYVRPRKLKLSTRAELRYDLGSGVAGAVAPTAGNPRGVGAANVDPRQLVTPTAASGNYADRLVTPGSYLLPSVGKRWQLVTRSALSWAPTRALTLMARANYYRTYNATEERLEAEALEVGFGAALRPPKWDRFNLLLKYTRILEMRPISLTEDLSRRRTYDVLSVVPIFELFWRLQLVEKLAYKRVHQRLDLLDNEEVSTVVHTLLWINRLNLHLTGRLDAGVEYRFMRMFLDGQGDQLRHGALVEMGYWIHRLVRLGAGYNFSRFSDNEFVDQDRDTSGFFFRVVGRY